MRQERLGFIFLAGIPGIALLWFLMELPGAFNAARSTLPKWRGLPQLGFTFDVRIDALSLIMALLVTGVGTLVLLYSARYFSSSAAHLGRFAEVFLAFAGAMLGLVTTDSTPALLFWELTTVFSFLLIGHYSDRTSSRRAAQQAIIVTTVGGLAMLVGIVILGEMPGGSYLFSEL